jgi:hypothetical protein
LGTLHTLLGRHSEAIAEFERVMQMTGGVHPQAAEKLANAYACVGDWHQVKKTLEILERVDKVPDGSKFQHACAYLITGDFQKGWRVFDEALPLIGDPNIPHGVQYFRKTLRQEKKWHGESLQGKRLLIWSEHGLGDSLMMFRYVRLIGKRFGQGTLTLWASQPLVRLFAECGEVQVETIGNNGLFERADFDFHVSLMSLPNIFETYSEADIPRAVPYLPIPQAEKDRWVSYVKALDGVKVGLVWAGNASNEIDQRRSVLLASLAPFFDVQGVSWISLQKGDAAAQLPLVRWPVSDFMEQCCDMLDTAALISHLDLVISVDTSVVHLAGALGCPVWLLNRQGSEWRWMLDRSDSPWYPSMKIFQQKELGNWAPVIAEVAHALSLLVNVK